MTDQQASFVAEITRCQPRLRGLIRCMLVGTQHIEDVLQETNMVLWKKSVEFESGTDFWAWASTIARFQVLAHLKKLKRDRHIYEVDILSELAAVAVEKLSQNDERQESLEQCIQSLPVPQRQLLEMRYGRGDSIAAIAKQLDRPEGSIKQTMYRIRTALLNCIERRLQTTAEPSS